MDETFVSQWMIDKLEKDGCLYQDDVVDFLVKSKMDIFLRENSDGNQVLNIKILNHFRKITELNVVWVLSGRYWRYRVKEDEEGRNSRG